MTGIGLPRRDLPAPSMLMVAGAAGGVIVLGLLVERDPIVAVLAASALLIALVTARSPGAAMAVVLSVLVLLPTYYGVRLGRSFTADLGAITAGVLVAFVLLGRYRQLAPLGSLALPVCFLGLFWTLASIMNQPGATWRSIAGASVSELMWPVIGISLGWVFVRLAGTRAFLRASAVALIVASLSGLLEFAMNANPWTTLGLRFMTDQAWALHLERFGHIRVSGAFNHPIAYGLFCAGFFLIALAVAITDDSPRWRAVGMVACGAGLIGLYLSGSRGPAAALAIVVLGHVLLLTRKNRAIRPAWLLASAILIVGLTVAVLTGAAGGALGALGLSTSGPDYSSITYRFQLLETVARFHVQSWAFGTGSRMGVDAFSSFVSLDNDYIARIVQLGILGLFAWVFAVVAPIVVYIEARLSRRRLIEPYAPFLLGAVAVHVLGYATVAEFGIGNAMFFILVGACWALLVAKGRVAAEHGRSALVAEKATSPARGSAPPLSGVPGSGISEPRSDR